LKQLPIDLEQLQLVEIDLDGVLVVDLGGFVAVCNTKKPRTLLEENSTPARIFGFCYGMLWFGAFWLQVTSI